MSHTLPLAQKISELPKGLRTRFAPSPTGFLHLGHVASALYVWGIAQVAKAEIILRMEDHDQERCRKLYEESILEDLEWLGFEPDDGVSSAAPSPFRQSDHLERYDAAIRKLGRDAYHCVCSRKEITERNRNVSVSHELLYDGFCRTLNHGPNVRLRVENEDCLFEDLVLGLQHQRPSEQCGDFLLRDRIGQWTYNFAVAVDDSEEDIGLIIRGQDILPSTGRQILLREKLGSKRKVIHAHHPLIWADPNKKLSKRDHSTSIAQWKALGLRAEDIIGRAAFQVGLTTREAALSAREAGSLFS